MKITVALVLLTSLQVVARNADAQNVTLNLKQTEIRKVFRAIEKQTPFRFLYNYELAALKNRVDVVTQDQPVESVLQQVLAGSELTFKKLNSSLIVITDRNTPETVAERIVSGRVVSETGDPLVGVTVRVKGTNVGTVTDIDGNFKIDVPDNGVLIFSFTGFELKEVPVAGQATLTITLQESATGLSEVVVVGYGTQKKQDVTGAVAVLSSKDMEDRPNNQFGYAIQGKAAGVQVIRPSGQPQAGFSIRIRGTSTITAGSEPLYLVDGVPTTATNEINPADIESISVLKDASAAAIYGASGANGVVLITTKRGKNQKTKVSFDAYTGTAKVWKTLDVLNAAQYKDLMTEMGQSVDWTKYPYDNYWQDQVFRTGHSQNYQLGISGGNEKTGYYISGSFMNQEGVVITNKVERFSFKTNLDHQANNWLKVGTSLSFNRWKDVDVSENRKYGSVIASVTGAPVTDVYNADGTFAINPFIQDLENPVALLLKNEHAWTNYRFNGNVYGEVRFLENFKLRSMFGLEHQDGKYNAWVDPYTSREGRGFKGIADLYTAQRVFWISENTLSYTKTFGKNNLSALAGFVASDRSIDESNIHATGFGSNAVKTVNGGSIRSGSSSSASRRNVAGIGRLNYAYNERYLLTANFRADASSVFGAGENVWGYFPSFSAGWRISQEEFFNGGGVLNDLKLRAGWGVVGNDQVSDYASYGLVSTGAFYPIGGEVVPGTAPKTLENRELKWESTKQTNIGLDMAFWENRILFTTDFYIKKTVDMLLNRPIPASVGIETNVATKNIGTMENRGIEFQVSSRNLVRTLKWNTDFNISFNKSKVVSLDGGTIKVGYISDRGDVAIAMEDQPLGLFFGYISDGVDPETGDLIFRDLDGDSTLSDGDKTIIGNANPKFVFGLTNEFQYKNWTFSCFIQGVQGNDIFNATRIESEGLYDEGNQLATVLNRWKTPGQITDVPRATFNNDRNSLISSRFVEDGSFIRLKSVSLGYELPGSILNRLKIGRLYFYLTAENLLTFTNYSGFDPEVSLYGRSSDNTVKNIAPGVDFGTYPQSREYIFGLNLTF